MHRKPIEPVSYLSVLTALLINVTLLTGCATLPNISQVIDEAQKPQKPQKIMTAKGQLSATQSEAVMSRLKRSVAPTDVLGRLTRVVESVTDSPLTRGNSVSLLNDGPAAYAAMFAAIRHAKDHINLESYIIEDDDTGRKFAELLLQKRAEGIQVSLIYDCLGSINTPESFFQHLREGGIQVVGFNPLNPLNAHAKWDLTHRDHRKILIIDGKRAIIGGINISRVYSSITLTRRKNEAKPIHWRDTDIQIEGPAVAELQKLFMATWQRQGGGMLSGRHYFPTAQESGSALVRIIGSTEGESNRIPFIVYVSAITFAEQSVHMTNSYFIPDKQILKALVDAATRGVDVKIILPGITDSPLALHAQRHYYSELLKAGVQIYEQSTSLLHAKTVVIDIVWSTVGSTNMDYLSLLHNDEVNAIILNHDFSVHMEKMFANDLIHSKKIEANEWEQRDLLPRVRGWFISLFGRLL